MNATHYIIENELNVSRSEEYIENLLEQKKHPELTELPHKDNVVPVSYTHLIHKFNASMWITVRRRAARQHDFEQPNRFIYFAEFKKIGVFCVEIIEN